MANQDRTVRTFAAGEFVIVCERTVSGSSTGMARRKWDEDRIALTREELRIIADKYPVKSHVG